MNSISGVMLNEFKRKNWRWKSNSPPPPEIEFSAFSQDRQLCRLSIYPYETVAPDTKSERVALFDV